MQTNNRRFGFQWAELAIISLVALVAIAFIAFLVQRSDDVTNGVSVSYRANGSAPVVAEKVMSPQQ